MLTFEVADTGIGIKKENIAKLFDNFSQFDRSINRGIEGTGLGLSIAKNLCRLMHGDIQVSSEYGEGSVFTITVPQTVRDAEPFAAVKWPFGKRALIFDRRKLYVDSLCMTLQQLNVAYDAVMNSQEYENLLLTGDFSHVFTGAYFYEKTLEICKSRGSTPEIIILTGYGENQPQNTRSLTMPTYSLPIANIFNGIHIDVYTKEHFEGFTAPDARVLVVDDIPTNLAVVEGLLAPYKIAIDCRVSGEGAVEAVKRNSYDLVLMDHMMPGGMDGIEAVKVIRDMGGDFVSLPIVALTANAISGMKEMFLKSGFNDYLSKPIELRKLDEVLEKWIPREKQRKGGLAVPKNQKACTFDLRIPGIDGAHGLRMTGGSEAGYKKVLQAYYKDVLERLHTFAAPPLPENLAGFASEAHALKGASGTIGAKETAKLAALLEEAARKGDLEQISGTLPAFYANLEELAGNINQYLHDAESKNQHDETSDGQKNGGQDPAFLFEELRAALRHEDIGKIDSTIDELCKLNLNTEQSEVLDKASEFVLVSDFSGALEVLAKIWYH
jgi:CheY-like chemotaxis protein/HPt (histidine-containing phosphotransfer) domain-containing protein